MHGAGLDTGYFGGFLCALSRCLAADGVTDMTQRSVCDAIKTLDRDGGMPLGSSSVCRLRTTVSPPKGLSLLYFIYYVQINNGETSPHVAHTLNQTTSIHMPSLNSC